MLRYFWKSTQIHGSAKSPKSMKRVLCEQVEIHPGDLKEAMGLVKDLWCKSTSNSLWKREYAPEMGIFVSLKMIDSGILGKPKFQCLYQDKLLGNAALLFR